MKASDADLLAVVREILGELNDAKKFDDNAPYPARCEVIGYREALVDVAMKLDALPCAPPTPPAERGKIELINTVLRTANDWSNRYNPNPPTKYDDELRAVILAWRKGGYPEAPPAESGEDGVRDYCVGEFNRLFLFVYDEMGIELDIAGRKGLVDTVIGLIRKPPTPPAERGEWHRMWHEIIAKVREHGGEARIMLDENEPDGVLVGEPFWLSTPPADLLAVVREEVERILCNALIHHETRAAVRAAFDTLTPRRVRVVEGEVENVARTSNKGVAVYARVEKDHGIKPGTPVKVLIEDPASKETP